MSKFLKFASAVVVFLSTGSILALAQGPEVEKFAFANCRKGQQKIQILAQKTEMGWVPTGLTGNISLKTNSAPFRDETWTLEGAFERSANSMPPSAESPEASLQPKQNQYPFPVLPELPLKIVDNLQNNKAWFNHVLSIDFNDPTRDGSYMSFNYLDSITNSIESVYFLGCHFENHELFAQFFAEAK